MRAISQTDPAESVGTRSTQEPEHKQGADKIHYPTGAIGEVTAWNRSNLNTHKNQCRSLNHVSEVDARKMSPELQGRAMEDKSVDAIVVTCGGLRLLQWRAS